MIGTISVNYFATLQQTGVSTFIELRKQMTYPIVFYRTKESLDDPLYWNPEIRDFFLRKVERFLNRDFLWFHEEACLFRGCLYPNFYRQGPIWDELPPYHGDKLPADYQQGKRQRFQSTSSDDDDDEETKAYQSFPKPPSVIPCLVREKVDKIQDDLSDDDFQISSCTVAPSKKRAPEKSTAVTSVDIETSIWRFMNPSGIPVIMSNTDDEPQCSSPARSLPVFVGLLSLAAVPSCRILTTIDLDHARY